MDNTIVLTVFDGPQTLVYQMPSDLDSALTTGQQVWYGDVTHLGKKIDQSQTWWAGNHGQLMLKDGTAIRYEVQRVLPCPDSHEV